MPHNPLVGLAAVDGQVVQVGVLVAAVLQGPAVEGGTLGVRLVAQVLVPLVADLDVRQRPLPRLARLLFVEGGLLVAA
jgi:hypothetical protein